MGQVELQLPPDDRFVALARLVVVAAARDAGMDELRREDLRIAVSEATTSAIAARARATVADPVVLRFGPDGAGFEVTVSGAGEVAASVGEGDDRAGRDGSPGDDGLATTVIRGLADEVEFVQGEGSEVALRFALSLGDGEGGGANGAAVTGGDGAADAGGRPSAAGDDLDTPGVAR